MPELIVHYFAGKPTRHTYATLKLAEKARDAFEKQLVVHKVELKP